MIDKKSQRVTPSRSRRRNCLQKVPKSELLVSEVSIDKKGSNTWQEFPKSELLDG